MYSRVEWHVIVTIETRAQTLLESPFRNTDHSSSMHLTLCEIPFTLTKKFK